jgi:hypothetical protein
MIAIFEGMLDPKSRNTVIAKGPFTVEVFENPDRPKYFRARMLPTRQQFFEMHTGVYGTRPVPLERSTSVDVRASMEFRFKKKLKDWHEPEAHGESAALVKSPE